MIGGDKMRDYTLEISLPVNSSPHQTFHFSSTMAAVTSPSSTSLNLLPQNRFSTTTRFRHASIPSSTSRSRSGSLTVTAMAPQNKVNRYDGAWEKKWFGAGIFYESSEDVEVDVFKKLETKKVLSNVEKAGLLSKAEELGFTLSSIEKLGVFSKAEELGLLSLLEKIAASSPSVLASLALPILVAALAAVVVIPDDSVALVALQAVVGGGLALGAAGLLLGSVLLGGLQEAD